MGLLLHTQHKTRGGGQNFWWSRGVVRTDDPSETERRHHRREGRVRRRHTQAQDSTQTSCVHEGVLKEELFCG